MNLVASGSDGVSHRLTLNDLQGEDALELLNALIVCASALLRTQHDSSRVRRRRTESFRSQCIVQSIRNRDTPALNVFRGRMICTDQFMADRNTASQSWESSSIFFASTDAQHLADLTLFDVHTDLATDVALDALRHNLRFRLSRAVESNNIIGVHHGFLQRGDKKTHLYIPGGQMDACEYECQTFKHSVIWLMKTSVFEEKVLQGEKLDGGCLFLCTGTSLNLTRLTIVPDGSHLLPTNEDSVPCVCIITHDVHDYIFTYECLNQACPCH